MKNTNETLTTEEFDRLFGEGKEDITPYLDMSSAKRINWIPGGDTIKQNESRRVNVDFPAWMVDALDREAAHLGVTRQSLIKGWLANCLTRDAHITGRV